MGTMRMVGTRLAAGTSGVAESTVVLAVLLAVWIAWSVFRVVVTRAILRTPAATEESAHLQDLILGELRRQRGAGE